MFSMRPQRYNDTRIFCFVGSPEILLFTLIIFEYVKFVYLVNLFTFMIIEEYLLPVWIPKLCN